MTTQTTQPFIFQPDTTSHRAHIVFTESQNDAQAVHTRLADDLYADHFWRRSLLLEHLGSHVEASTLKYALANAIIAELLGSPKRRTGKTQVLRPLPDPLPYWPERKQRLLILNDLFGPSHLADDIFSPEFPPPKPGKRPLPDPLPYWWDRKHRMLNGEPLTWEVWVTVEIR